ncbi:MAG TPA: Gfo/Idh/MocA family oxidoreductase [Bacilli bacterium]
MGRITQIKEINVGVIGLDSSHSIAFTELLNNIHHPYHVSGGKVVAAYPGGSSDIDISISRVPDYTEQLDNEYGIHMCSSIEEVVEMSDAILLLSLDGRIHAEQFKQIAVLGKPVFIDKPFTINHIEAGTMFNLAEEWNVPLLSCSALRFADPLSRVLNETRPEAIYGADCFGPLPLLASQPGWFWYGIHTVEMLYRIMGKGCLEVTAMTTDQHEMITARWEDGRIGSARGNRAGNQAFGASIHMDSGVISIDINKSVKPFYACLLEEIIHMFKTGRAPVSRNETLELIRFIEAANESRVSKKTVFL